MCAKLLTQTTFNQSINHLFAQTTTKTFTSIQVSRAGQQGLIKTLTAARKGVQHDNNTIYNYSKLQTRKREKSTLTMLVLNVHNFEKITVGCNAFQTFITQSTKNFCLRIDVHLGLNNLYL